MESFWQTSFTRIKERGRYLLETGKFSDCKFLVGSAENQRIICAHKIFLSMASPVFERMFFGSIPIDADEAIHVPDVLPDAFQNMLEYIYSDRFTLSSFDRACELCYVAKKYMLPHVVEKCTQILWLDLGPKNACKGYEFAKLFDEPHLLQKCMEIISAYTCDVLNDPSFVDIEVTTLLDIFDQDELNIDSELDLFNALIRYAKERTTFTDDDNIPNQQSSGPLSNQQEQNDSRSVVEIKMEPDVAVLIRNHEDDDGISEDDNQDQDVIVVDSDACSANGDSPRSSNYAVALLNAQRRAVDVSVLRQALMKIRFLTLTPQQFAEGPARSKLLQQDEALAILIKISSPSCNDYPMPEGFCTSRCPRKYSKFTSTGPILNATLDSAPLDMAPQSSSTSYQQPQRVLNPFYNVSASNSTTMPDRCLHYCVRTLTHRMDYHNTDVVDCGVTFQADTNVFVVGVQVPTQILKPELVDSVGVIKNYTEIIYAHIEDMQGTRLTYTHHTSRVLYGSLLEILFDCPVYIQHHKIYKVHVVFNKPGWYPIYNSILETMSHGINFKFKMDSHQESIFALVFCDKKEIFNGDFARSLM